MSRGGRGGGRGGGGKKGPDMSWDDEEPTKETPDARKPAPLFPDRYIPAPRPLNPQEKLEVTTLLSLRDRIRRGPLYAILDPTILQSQNKTTTTSNTDPVPTKPNPRAGFNPFTDQEKYSMKYTPKKRTCPDLSHRPGYTLRLFPLELWTTLDPQRLLPDWTTLTDEQKARITQGAPKPRKRKRETLKFDDDAGDEPVRSDADESDEDPESSAARKRKRAEAKRKADEAKTRQKKGLDAEDDYPEAEQEEEADGGEEEVGDSEFGSDEEEDDGGDDYNAEQYFDDGADEVGDGDGDGDVGGEF